MANEHTFQPMSRGPRLRLPTLRVMHRPVAAAGGNGRGWQTEKPQPLWQAMKMQWGIDAAETTLTLRVMLGANDAVSRHRPEGTLCRAGDQVRLVQAAAGSFGDSNSEIEWFRGVIAAEQFLIGAEPDVESFSVTACGPEMLLAGKVVVGQWWPRSDLDATEIAGGQGNGQGQLTYSQAVREGVWSSTLPAIMNPGGRGNASVSNWKLLGQSAGGYLPTAENSGCKVFTAPGRTAGSAGSTAWTVYTALRSTVEWVDGGEILSGRVADWAAIQTLLGDVPLGTVDLTGLNLIEAMRAILSPSGFSFAIEPWTGPDGRHRLIVFRRHNPVPSAPIFMPAVNGDYVSITSVSGQRAQVQRVQFERDCRAVHNRILVVGDVKRTQRTLVFHETSATRDLHPYWDTSAFDLDDYDDGNLIGPNHFADSDKRTEWFQRYQGPAAEYRHVFRTFAWNEDGALSDVIRDEAGQPILPDLSAYGSGGSGSSAAHRARPIGPRLEFADPGAHCGALKAPLVEIGIAWYEDGEFTVDDASWIELPASAAAVRTDRAAVTIVEPDLLAWRPWAMHATLSGSKTLHELYGHLTWPTLLHNALRAVTDGSFLLRLRVTGTIEIDECVRAEAGRAIDSAWPLDSVGVVRMGGRFRYRADGQTVSASLPATVDDSAGEDSAMAVLARRLRDAAQDARGSGSITLRGLHRIYSPGMGAGRISGRNVDLTVGAAGGAEAPVVPSIVAVAWDFGEQDCKTQLFLDTLRPQLS